MMLPMAMGSRLFRLLLGGLAVSAALAVAQAQSISPLVDEQRLTQSLATLQQKKVVTMETALAASSNRDELQDLIARGVGVVAGAGLSRPGAPRVVAR